MSTSRRPQPLRDAAVDITSTPRLLVPLVPAAPQSVCDGCDP
ncbi:MAG: hypothetical protein ACRDRX_04360 [Pseudonocardiaceae bacterium]